jgi:hypothetical protein
LITSFGKTNHWLRKLSRELYAPPIAMFIRRLYQSTTLFEIEASGRKAAYGYDDLYRLTTETITSDATAANNGQISYGYDAVGNRLTRTSSISAIPTTTNSYDANDRLTTDTYDINNIAILLLFLNRQQNRFALAHDFERNIFLLFGKSRQKQRRI